MTAKTSANVLIENMEILYENIYNLLKAFQEAASNTLVNPVVVLKNIDGTTREVTVTSFRQLQQEMNRLSNNFNALTNSNNLSYILNPDGTVSQYLKTTFINAQYLDLGNIEIGDTCKADFASNIPDFMYPLVKIPVTISSELVHTDIYCRSFQVHDGYDMIPEQCSWLELQQLMSNGTVVADDEIDRVLSPYREQVRYFGKFNIEQVETTQNSNIWNVTLNDVHYTGLNVNGNNIELKVNDELVTTSGNTRFLITDISIFNNYVVLRRIAGDEAPTVGINKLLFNQVIDAENFVVGIPVKPHQDLVVFLSTQSKSAISYPSVGIKISTTDYKVDYNGQTYTIDEFFSNYVTNLGEYLMGIVDESSVPYSLGIKPAKPELLGSNFKVVQINKHLLNAKSVANINELNAEKAKIQNNIDSKNKKIAEIKANIQSNHYSTVAEKQNKQESIENIQAEIETLNANLLTITRRIENESIQNNTTSVKAKYKIVGFWHLQDDLYSPSTGMQHIVKYEVQYRYLSQNSDNIENTTLDMVDNGTPVSVTFSAWNVADTAVLNKTKAVDGSIIWENPQINSTDDLNINQCMITINENESVEIRVRAISEAGYPIAPLKSEWSDIIRVNFPDEFKQNNINTIVESNQLDLRKAEMNQILKEYGVIEHVQDEILENDAKYFHKAASIASGFYTQEMKNIPLDTFLKNLRSDIDALQNSHANPLTVSVIDPDNNEFEMSNDQTLNVFVGNFSEQYDAKDYNNFGKIITKKLYIKLKNNNQVPIDIKSLQPNGITELDDLYKYVPVVTNTGFHQETGQIIYFRKLNLTMNSYFELYKPYEVPELTLPLYGNISQRLNVAFLLNDVITQGYVDINDVSFATATSMNLAAPEGNITYDNLHRIMQYSDFITGEKQLLLNDDLSYRFSRLGFSKSDEYGAGLYTCGSMLYPIFGDLTRFKVRGESSTSVMVLEAGKEILLPIIFEYRMLDTFGRPSGTVNPTDIEYRKTLGVALNIGNKPFNFDLSVYVKY